MKHGSLFSGIGGFDLAAEWAGWTNVFQVEWNEYCQKILKKNFPDARIYSDIRDFDGRHWRGSVDIISGGFPCQPYSSAGKRLGREDDRHLWPEMLRIIREAAPRWVVGENVRGIVSWSVGLVFDEVQSDLEAAGYEVGAFILPAASVNAPHRRDRVLFVAHRSGEQMGTAGQSREHGGMEPTAANATRVGQEKRTQESNQKNTAKNGIGLEYPTERPRNAGPDSNPQGQQVGGMLAQWDEWTTESPVCGVDDGVPRRMDRIAALGNAVVPQLVWRIFDTINAFNCQ